MAARKRTVKAVTEEVVEDKKVVEAPKPAPKRVFDLHEYVSVKNGFHGRLVYTSRSTGEEFMWEEYGDELDITLKELRDAKVSAKGFFINNYFVIEDEEVLDYLGVKKYYNHAIPIECFDDIFDLPPEELKAKIAEMPSGQKASLAYRARILYSNDAIDSMKTIKALEEALHIELQVKD